MDLHAPVLEGPDDRDGLMVLSDWYTAHGDPRGRLIRDELAGVTGPALAQRYEAARAHVLGELAPFCRPEPFEFSRRNHYVFVRGGGRKQRWAAVAFRYCRVVKVRLRGMSTASLRPLAQHSAGLLEVFEAHPPTGVEESYPPAALAQAVRDAPHLAVLDISSRHVEAEELMRHAPSLEILAIAARTIGRLGHPLVRELSLAELVDDQLTLDFPRLERLNLSRCRRIPPAAFEGIAVSAEVTLHRCERPVLDALLASSGISAIKRLCLEHGGQRWVGRWLRRHGHRLAHVDFTDVNIGRSDFWSHKWRSATHRTR